MRGCTPRNIRHILRYKKDKVFENTNETALEREVKEYIKSLPEFDTPLKVKDECFRLSSMSHKIEDVRDEE
jgi:hypothetical protein